MRAVLTRGFAVKVVTDPRFFPEALRGCRNAGQALDLYLNSSAQFSFEKYTVPLFQTLLKLRVSRDRPQPDYDTLTETSLLKDVRFGRLMQDLTSQSTEMTPAVLLDAFSHLTNLYNNQRLPAELEAHFLTRLQSSWPQFHGDAVLLSKALRLCATVVTPGLQSQATIKEILKELVPRLQLADAETTVNVTKALTYMPWARQYLSPLLQPLVLKVTITQHMDRMESKNLAKVLLDGHRNHMLTPEVMEEGVSVLVGRLYTMSVGDVVQVMKVYQAYVAGSPKGELGRVPEQCAKIVLRQLRSCSPADILYLLETLPQFRISTPAYYELFCIEVIRSIEDYSIPDLIRASFSMASVGLKSQPFLRKLVERVRLLLKQEVELVVDPETSDMTDQLKKSLFPEQANRPAKVGQVSLSTPELSRLLWSLTQLALRANVEPLHGEEWRALVHILESRLQTDQGTLTLSDYDRLTQVAWFSRKYFPTYPPLPVGNYRKAFQMDTEDIDVKLDK